jgi:enamine deaminase RidA (YjgF/YER057c/UK114 family)
MTESIEKRIHDLGITLPRMSTPVANYVPFVIAGDLLFLAGQGPRSQDGSWHVGKVGESLSVEEAYQDARLAGLNMLSAVNAALGTLDRVERVVRVLAFVCSTSDFKSHPRVTNGCSDLLVEVFGEAGKHVRSSIGVESLPEGMSVEIEGIFRVATS